MCARSVIVALAVGPRQHPLAHAGQLRGLEHRRDPAFPGVVGPLPERLGDSSVKRVALVPRGLRRSCRRTSWWPRPAPARTAVRLVERLQQAQPVVGGVGAEDVGVAGVYRGDPRCGQRVEAAPPSLGFSTMTAMSPAWSGSPSNVAPLSSRAAMSAARSCGMWWRRSSIGMILSWPRPNAVAATPPAAGTGRCAGRPRAGDPGGGPRPCARRCRGGRARRPAARPAGGRRGPRRCASWCPASAALPAVDGGVQVGEDVAAAERVDGLLRVSDEDQRRVAAERAVDHLPLHRVGVLELVDHHDRPPPMHA